MFLSLSLLPLLDSAFPTGAFSHSFGLETALQERRIKHPSELSRWLASYIKGSLVPTEGAAVFWAHGLVRKMREMGKREEAARDGICERLKELDRRLTVSKLAREAREGGMKIGRRYLRIVAELYPCSGIDEYEAWIREGTCYGHPCVVHGWICAYLDQPAKTAVLSHLYAGVNNLLQNAMRAMAIGQTAGQKVLHGLLPLLEREAENLVRHPPAQENLFSFVPVQEIQAMRHERLYSRLFMS
ncbi:urease accessory protein UreF [Bacillaceae bacterium]